MVFGAPTETSTAPKDNPIQQNLYIGDQIFYWGLGGVCLGVKIPMTGSGTVILSYFESVCLQLARLQLLHE